MFGYYHRNDVLRIYNTSDKPASIEEVKTPQHIRGFFEVYNGKDADANDLSDFIYPKVLSDAASFVNGLAVGKATHWTNKGLEHEEGSEYQEEEDEICEALPADANYGDTKGADQEIVESAEDEGITDLEVARDLVARCSAVIGLHPDQATEHIVRFAVSNDVPCAVIPCCVYGKQFPNR
jgi:hypothetical protein